MITTHLATPAGPAQPVEDLAADLAADRPAPVAIGAAATSRRPLIVLGVGIVATTILFVLQTVDAGGLATAWELAHWNVSALAATIAAVLATTEARGLMRRVRFASAVGLGSWLLSNLAWTALIALDIAAAPSISDVLAVGFLVPGAWAMVSIIRGRLSRAEEIALYLDAASLLVAIVAVLVTVAGSAAIAASGVPGLVLVVYPSLFLGAGGVALVGVLADRSPLRDGARLATGVGVLLIGTAYVGWTVPQAIGAATDSPLDVLFSVGALVAGYGAISWTARDADGARPIPHEARPLTWAVAPAALVVTMLGASLFAPSHPGMAALLDILAGVTVALLVVRFAIHLQERSAMVADLERARAENHQLIGRLRTELDQRERAQQRLIDASRMSAVGELAAAIAHEVNNPLTSVLGYADLLVSAMDPDDPRRGDVEVIRSESIRVRDRLRSLLEFAAPRRTVLVGADLAAVVAAPLELLRYHLQRRGVAIDVRSEPMPTVETDPSAIQQVIINLVTELAGAMAAGGRIGVVTRADGDRATILIEPDRPGIDLDRVTDGLPELGADTGDGADRLNASLGLLRGHGATIRTRCGVSGRAQVEISLPFLAEGKA